MIRLRPILVNRMVENEVVHRVLNETHRVVILISADEEWRVVRCYLCPHEVNNYPFGEYFKHDFDNHKRHKSAYFCQTGCGKIPAAAATQCAINQFKPKMIINLGTCGGFLGRVKKNDILVVKETVVYDIYERTGNEEAQIEKFRTSIDLSWIKGPYPMDAEPVTMATADQDLDPEMISGLIEKFGAKAADWESGAIAYVAQRNQLKCLILRGVSDVVGSSIDGPSSEEEIRKGTHTVMKRLIRGMSEWALKSGSAF